MTSLGPSLAVRYRTRIARAGTVLRVGERGGVVTYLYWSNRLTEDYLEDNGIESVSITETITSPGFRLFPTFSRSSTRQSSRRAQVAKTIESDLGQLAVANFNSPGPIAWAKGRGSVIFGEFRVRGTSKRPMSVIFTSTDYDERDKDSVAICLFGSMDNFSGRIKSAGPGFDSGWTSSNAPYIFQFLQDNWVFEFGRDVVIA